ncbi:MAG: TSUP family transporter, partial [Dehalococcoidia bacterium]|nr:TSUP family transporter [Dehalococcoidia bacterium]
ISITASAGAFVFYQRGYVEPLIVAPVLIGALLGAQVGAQVMRRTPGYRIRMTFSGVLFVGAVVMSLRAAGVEV